MSDHTLPLSRPADAPLAAMRRADEGPRRLYPVWRLMLAALFMAAAALSGATVMIFGAPGAADQGAGQGGAVRVAIVR